MTKTSTTSIAFLCHPYHRGGVTRWMVDAAEEYARSGFETFFITVNPRKEFLSGKNRPKIIDLFSENRPDVLKIRTKDVSFLFEFGFEEYRAFTYEKLILDNVPAGVPVIVSDDHSVWKAAALVADRNPFIGVLHSDDPNYFNLAQTYYRHIAAFVAVSQRIANTCKTFPALDAIPIEVIPCGIKIASSAVGFSEKNPMLKLIWIGRLEEQQKRVSDLPKIALALKNASIAFHLDIIGHGSDGEMVKAELVKNKLEQEVTIHGWKDASSIQVMLSHSDIMLLPSNYEGMSIAVMEALAAGCGVVSTRVSGVEDLENNPLSLQCLWLFEIGNITEALECVRLAMTTDQRQRILSARELARQEFSIENCILRYKNVIGSLHSPVPKANLRAENKTVKNQLSKILALLRYLKLQLRS